MNKKIRQKMAKDYLTSHKYIAAKKYLKSLNLYEEEEDRLYLGIDVSAFYLSCEAIDHGENPLQTLGIVLSGTLIMSTSKFAKLKYGFSNVMRIRPEDVPKDVIVYPARMGFYALRSLQVYDWFCRRIPPKYIHVYSRDEMIIDITTVWKGRSESPAAFAMKLQEDIRKDLGFYMSAGIGPNFFLAKVAMDIEAKKHLYDKRHLFAQWTYDDVFDKLWNTELIEVWNIGASSVRTLNELGYYSLADIALGDPELLRKKMGMRGLQIYMRAWGLDHTRVEQRGEYQPKSVSIGHGMTLPRAFTLTDNIINEFKGLSDACALDLLKINKQAACISIYVGYEKNSYENNTHENSRGFIAQTKIVPTNRLDELHEAVEYLFNKKYNYLTAPPIRRLGVHVSKLQEDRGSQTSLFEDPEISRKRQEMYKAYFDTTQIYGKGAVYLGYALSAGSQYLHRTTLIGGHPK
ncbi:DNA polymerase V [Lactovum miscens]|uniref:DNA polymerase V n=2 Tax=Lactovum miscens TaxID=190387 RepID=A0A841C6L5_9LACT|nr:DNA polymerase V [Lactovum miscens]